MPNMLMMHYAATKDNRDEQRSEMRYDPRRETRGDGGQMMGDYDRGMAYEEPASRRMNDPTRNDYGGAESRYRGKDGRWKAGTRRSEYDGTMAAGDHWPDHHEADPASNRYRRRSGGDDGDDDEQEYNVRIKPSNVIEWPYGNPDERRNNRQIGFGARNAMDDEQMHHHPSHEMGYGSARMGEPHFDRSTAEKWVKHMQNEDKSHPIGGKWSADMLRPMAQKYGIPTDGKRFWEFYAMTNAMYSDYGEVARRFGITSPEFYVCLAKAWMDDKDAEPDKTALYYEYIVKKEDMGTAK